MFKKVDHLAIVVRDTEEAQKFQRDGLWLEVLLSEVLAGAGVRLTHLDMGNVKLQLVEPMTEGHPVQAHLEERGEGLRHVCWKVGDIDEAMEGVGEFGLEAKAGEAHAAPQGGRAAFIEPGQTRGVLWEMTGNQLSVSSSFPCRERGIWRRGRGLLPDRRI